MVELFVWNFKDKFSVRLLDEKLFETMCGEKASRLEIMSKGLKLSVMFPPIESFESEVKGKELELRGTLKPSLENFFKKIFILYEKEPLARKVIRKIKTNLSEWITDTEIKFGRCWVEEGYGKKADKLEALLYSFVYPTSREISQMKDFLVEDLTTWIADTLTPYVEKCRIRLLRSEKSICFFDLYALRKISTSEHMEGTLSGIFYGKSALILRPYAIGVGMEEDDEFVIVPYWMNKLVDGSQLKPLANIEDVYEEYKEKARDIILVLTSQGYKFKSTSLWEREKIF